ncbi:MAG: class I SAM-dependent methyltransferase [Kofleriaceae bacterium]
MVVTQDANNRRLYARDLVRHYARTSQLNAPEKAVLDRFAFDHASMLELGCGAGRFTSHVERRASRFVGVDISPHMVRHCRKRFPTSEFVERDMRDLAMHADGGFDAVFAVSNVLDCVDHWDRIQILHSLRRVIAPGGLFVFSSHNRAWTELGAKPELELTLHPITLARRLVQFGRSRIRQALARRLEQHTNEFAIVTDSGHEYSLLHYYITRAMQAEQLADHGFTLLETFAMSGDVLGDREDRESPSLMYVARRR